MAAGKKNAADKAFAVLEAVADPGAPHRLADIATRADIPKSTAHRILQLLGRSGYVMPVLHGTYTIGPHALALAGQMLAGSDLRTLVEPRLRELRDETGYTVHFAVLDGSTAVYVVKVEGDQPYRMASRIGMPISLHCTAIGKAILASLGTEHARRLLDSAGIVRRTPRTLKTARAVLEDVDRTRERGFSIDDEENEANVRCVGAGVRNSLGEVIGAISISTLALELTPDDAVALGPVVRSAAADVTAALGGPAADGAHPRVPAKATS